MIDEKEWLKKNLPRAKDSITDGYGYWEQSHFEEVILYIPKEENNPLYNKILGEPLRLQGMPFFLDRRDGSVFTIIVEHVFRFENQDEILVIYFKPREVSTLDFMKEVQYYRWRNCE